MLNWSHRRSINPAVFVKKVIEVGQQYYILTIEETLFDDTGARIVPYMRIIDICNLEQLIGVFMIMNEIGECYVYQTSKRTLLICGSRSIFKPISFNTVSRLIKSDANVLWAQENDDVFIVGKYADLIDYTKPITIDRVIKGMIYDVIFLTTDGKIMHINYVNGKLTINMSKFITDNYCFSHGKIYTFINDVLITFDNVSHEWSVVLYPLPPPNIFLSKGNIITLFSGYDKKIVFEFCTWRDNIKPNGAYSDVIWQTND